MEQLLFQHMETVRNITNNSIKKIPEDMVQIIPEGFNNNIHWNFGHIAYTQEKLVYVVRGEEMGLPKEYEEYFAAGTKPSEWKGAPPSLAEISKVLAAQPERIKESVTGKLQIELPTPFTNKAGITFHSVGETFLFSFYHEALHMEAIKRIYRTIKIKIK